MSNKELNYNKSYEWVGSFWFEEEHKFSGKATYSPEAGILLELTDLVQDMDMLFSHYAKKIMHGLVKGENGPVALSFMNVYLSPVSYGVCRVLKGNAAGLLSGVHIDDVSFDALIIQYDQHFENIFLHPVSRELEMLELEKNAGLIFSNGFSINAKAPFMGKPIFNINDLGSVFWSRKDPDLTDVKTALAPIIANKDIDLVKRNTINFQIAIKNENTDLSSFMVFEHNWRYFWELVIDHPISIEMSWLSIRDIESKRSYSYSFLSAQCLPKKKKREALMLLMLPLNIYSFSNTNEMPLDLSYANETLNIWMDSQYDPIWKPIIKGLQRILDANSTFGDTTPFVSLISDIETFLDIKGDKVATPDTLIDTYASDEWLEGFNNLELDFPKNKTKGKNISEIRNTITHPKSGIKKIKYQAIVQNPYKLQSVYAYVGALLVKAVLIHCGGIDETKVEDFTKKFIESRTSFEPLQYS